MTNKKGDQESPKALATPIPQSTTARVPPPETSETTHTRFYVIAAFWAVIVFLGFPLWWQTTSIYRAHLPIQDMVDWDDGKACRPVFPLEIHVAAPSMQIAESQHLLRTTQHTLDDLNEFAAHHLRLKLANDTSSSTANGEQNTDTVDNAAGEGADVALTVRVLPQDDLAAPRSELHADTTLLDVFYPPNQVPLPSSSNPPLSAFIAQELQGLYSEEKATIAHILSGETTGFDSESISRRLRRSMKYADTYHLSFSLFTPGAVPSSWDIETAVKEYLSPLLHAFAPISNFTIDTQVQLYATFSPMTPAPVYDETEAAWTLKKEDLSAFINAAEWPLNPSIGSGPTLNFILYVPAPSQSPMVVKENRASSWIVPQWGGVYLLNPTLLSDKNGQSNPPSLTHESLRPAFMTFSHQLLTLLGTPTTSSASTSTSTSSTSSSTTSSTSTSTNTDTNTASSTTTSTTSSTTSVIANGNVTPVPSSVSESSEATFTSSSKSTSTCPEYPTNAVIVGFFPGALFGAVLALLISTCLRHRSDKKREVLENENAKVGHNWSISGPIPSEDASYRTDFLLRGSSDKHASMGSKSMRSMLNRSGTRVRSLFSGNPRLDKDVPPLPTQNPTELPTPPEPAQQPPVTPPRQREPSTESIKVYSPPGAFAQSRRFLGPEPYPSRIARPSTTFEDLVQAVGFNEKEEAAKGNKYFKVHNVRKIT